MSIMEVTTRITHRWLERKNKRELAAIIMANIDKIDILAETPFGASRNRLLDEAIMATAERCAEIAQAGWKPGDPHARLKAAEEIRAEFTR